MTVTTPTEVVDADTIEDKEELALIAAAMFPAVVAELVSAFHSVPSVKVTPLIENAP